MKKSKIKILCIIVAGCLLLGLAGAELFKYFGPNNTYTDMLAYLGLSSQDEWVLLCNTENKGNAISRNNHIYLPLSVVNETISSRFYYDSSLDALIVVTPDEIKIATNGSDCFIKIANEGYVDSDFLGDSYPCVVEKNEQNRIISIWSDLSHEYQKKVCISESKMRVAPSIRSEIVCDILVDDEVSLLSFEGDYSYCITSSGLKGYIKTKDLSEVIPYKKEYLGAAKESFAQLDSGKICMGWHMLDEYTFATQTETLSELIASEPGLNVVSPTWYSVKDFGGSYTDNSSAEYVNYAHSHGIKVWGLVDNFSPDMDNLILLSNYDTRSRLISGLVASAKECGMDGINMDFESSGAELGGLNSECGPAYIQFLRELTFAAHKEGLSVSVDVPVPYSFNSYFNRSELGKVVDYVIIMGYDEHYSGSEPGSVASYDFVSNGLTGTLNEVPANRVILGVPFYTRQWTLDETGAILGTREKTQKDLMLDLETYGGTPVWHDTEKQYYSEYYNEYGLVKVWLDDEHSLEWKIDLMRQFNIAGGAAWRLGAETPEMWSVFASY